LNKPIYFDYNATAPLRPEALEAMLPYLRERYGNSSSIHQVGQRARKAVEDAREHVAALLGAADVTEIVFTSCGTESDNAAIQGMALANMAGGKKHVITSAIEHSAVLKTCQFLEKQYGFRLTVLPVSSGGLVEPEALRRAITPDTVLVSIMTANNEIGTIQPIEQIGRICHERGVAFHTDAIQAAGKLPLSVKSWPVDMLSLSGHKFGGPKGTGALYIRRGVRLQALLHGGPHEKNRRAGTHNVAGIVGMGEAARLALQELPGETVRLRALRDEFERAVVRRVPAVSLNGDPEKRLCNTSSLRFECAEGEALVIALDQENLETSVGSACTTGNTEPSHVLTALGLSREQAHTSLRFSFGHGTSREEIGEALRLIPPVVERLRSSHPLWRERAPAAK
jgi:cysteine desulfurase